MGKHESSFTIPADITREIRQLKRDRNLPSLWRAVQIHFQEENNKIIRQALETLKIHIAQSTLTTAIADIYILKHPEQFAKNIHYIAKRVNQNIDAFASFLRPDIRQTLKKILGQAILSEDIK